MSDGIVIDDFITDVMLGFPDPVLEAQWGMGGGRCMFRAAGQKSH
jgi:hypothetical protein